MLRDAYLHRPDHTRRIGLRSAVHGGCFRVRNVELQGGGLQAVPLRRCDLWNARLRHNRVLRARISGAGCHRLRLLCACRCAAGVLPGIARRVCSQPLHALVQQMALAP